MHVHEKSARTRQVPRRLRRPRLQPSPHLRHRRLHNSDRLKQKRPSVEKLGDLRDRI